MYDSYRKLEDFNIPYKKGNYVIIKLDDEVTSERYYFVGKIEDNVDHLDGRQNPRIVKVGAENSTKCDALWCQLTTPQRPSEEKFD